MERNITLDYFKIILSFLVVSIHLPLFMGFHEESLEYILGWIFTNGLARIAVPCFFIINGYFLDISNKSKVIKYLKHVLILYIVWMLIYSPFYIDLLNSKVTYITTLLFGHVHLWYLASLLFAVALFYFTNKLLKGKSQILIILALILFIVGKFLEYWVTNNAPIPLERIDLYRNFLFFAFPYITIGHLLKKEQVIFSRKKSIYLIFVGLTTLIIESLISLYYTTGVDLYFSSFILCPVIINYFINHCKWKKRSNIISNLSAGIYFIHIIVIYLIVTTLRHYNLSQANNNIYLYAIVLILSLIAAYILHLLNKKIKILL